MKGYGEALMKMARSAKRSKSEIEAIRTGNPARTVILHPQVGKTKDEAIKMADQTSLPDGKWKGIEYREMKQAMEHILSRAT